ncbi:hypothetical protein DFH09DRAFT_953876 [Mycena vulgaris]|nr:hypothetical protein DFH09DRAFT_953876 [Mycena vulgaris]
MSSPFTSKLGTNYRPKDEEIAEIQSLLVEPTTRLKHLDDEITELREALGKLVDERDKLGAYVDAHRALISPVRRLPLDIVQEVFIACLPTHRNCVMSAVEAPVLLGRICSSWRAISLSTPRLWSRLHIVEPTWPFNSHSAFPTFEQKLAQRLQTTKIWLGRSGQCPLSISLQCTFNRAGFTPETQGLLFLALLPFASRWEHIAFTILPSVLFTASHLTEADVPMLKSVRIHDIDEFTGNAVRWDSFTFLRAPEMHSFSIMGTNLGPQELLLPWNRLKSLSILTGWTSDIALQVLSWCPQLRTCHFLVTPGNNSGGREPGLELSFLHTLDLLYHEGFSDTVRPLFSHLFLPQLRCLKLRGSFNNGDDIIYGPFLAAAPHLESLDFTSELFSKKSLADFLRELPPTILELKLSASDQPTPWYADEYDVFDDEILESLILSPDFLTPCCPGLHVLEITYRCSFSDETLLRFIKSRTLQRVFIRFAREMQVDIRPELEAFVQSGLDLELIYSSPEERGAGAQASLILRPNARCEEGISPPALYSPRRSRPQRPGTCQQIMSKVDFMTRNNGYKVTDVKLAPEGNVYEKAIPSLASITHVFPSLTCSCFGRAPPHRLMSSPFTSKLGTNYCPSDEETIAIQTLLVEPTLRLQRLDDDIADLRKALDKLADEREKLCAYVDAHKVLIMPVRRLPLDIIQEIFVACIPTHRNCVMSAVEAPVLLGRICSSWRTISLSTPRLWSKLHVVEPASPYFPVLIDEKVAQRLETTKMWLGRSGQRPLSISVIATASNTGFTAQIIQALLPFKSRWEHIAFTAESSGFTALSHLTEVDVPTIKSIHMTEIDDHTSFRWDSLQFLRSSNMLSAYISGGNFAPLELPLRWNGLRDLFIEIRWYRDNIALTGDMILQVFSRCPQLRTCRLQIDSEVENHSSLAELILELPFLHTLAGRVLWKPFNYPSSSVQPALAPTIAVSHTSWHRS